MADNYLENKMEEHRRMMSAQEGSRRHRQAPWAGGPVKFEPRRVIVAVCDAALRDATVRLLRKADYQVAFCSADRRAGQQLSQETGSRFYPAAELSAEAVAKMADDYAATRGEADFFITDDPSLLSAGPGRKILFSRADAEPLEGVNKIIVAADAEAAATIALFLTHSAAANLGGMVFRI